MYDVIPGKGTIIYKSSDQKQKFTGKNKVTDDIYPTRSYQYIPMVGHYEYFIAN